MPSISSERRLTPGRTGIGRGRPIVLSANSSWNIVNFRAGLIRALVAAGHEVEVLAPSDAHSARIEALGAQFTPIRIESSGLSPVKDLMLLRAYWRYFAERRPLAVLGFTIKPNIYGSIAARLTGTPMINNISGLGTAFLRKGSLRALVIRLYRVALARSAVIFFQNRDDLTLFVGQRLARADQVRLLPGSGVDLDRFEPRARPGPSGPFRFLLIGRLLWDKGLAEFVAAARMLRATHPEARFQLLGFVGSDNRSAVPRATIEAWVAEGLIDYLGESDDVRPAIAAADCVVLPSYREGLPRSLLEAAAMARPVIATNVPGCRDAVDDGETGYLCAPRSADALAAAMAQMIALDPATRKKMGECARQKAVREFDQRLVSVAYIQALAELETKRSDF